MSRLRCVQHRRSGSGMHTRLRKWQEEGQCWRVHLQRPRGLKWQRVWRIKCRREVGRSIRTRFVNRGSRLIFKVRLDRGRMLLHVNGKLTLQKVGNGHIKDPQMFIVSAKQLKANTASMQINSITNLSLIKLSPIKKTFSSHLLKKTARQLHVQLK